MTNLQKTVQEIIDTHAEDYENGRDGFIDDLSYGGCESGLVGELIYYTDTTDFYNNHREDISALLYDVMQQTGYTDPSDIFGDKWHKDDPLAIETQNINLLAWFAFEETAFRLAGYRE